MWMEDTIPFELTVEELDFLSWAMSFIEGGPYDGKEETRRARFASRIEAILHDLDTGIMRTTGGQIIYRQCALCDGTGRYDLQVKDENNEINPCPACSGKGYSTIAARLCTTLICRYCDGRGKVIRTNDHFVGQLCPVCGGLGSQTIPSDDHKTDIGLDWDLFHPLIANVARSRFDSGHYADAVEAAFKEINHKTKAIVRSRNGEELDGAQLMQKAFSPNQPIIHLGDLDTESGRNIQKGYMMLFTGSMIGIRNPKAHDNTDSDRSEALQLLALASLLMSKLEQGS